LREEDSGEASAKHLLTLTDRLTHEDLETVPDVGPVASAHVLGYFEENRDRIERLLPELAIIFPENIPVERDEDHPLAGMRFCVTGSFEGRSREELVALGESAGAAFSSSVGKNLDFLLAGEKAGSKLEKANALGIPVWTLEEFLESAILE
jgi:DNA ligase (NAD+)